MTQWEVGFWVGLALISPVLARPAWPRAVSLLSLSDSTQDLLRSLAPWLWGIGPAYMALISGAIPARFFGLTGRSPLAWFGGAIICGALIGLTASIQWPKGAWPTPTRGVLDEPRWALYRAAGIFWIPNPEWGLLMGLALALLEWTIRFRPWKGALKETPRRWRVDAHWPPGMWETLARMAGSSLLFGITRNFWLTAVSQAVLLRMVRRKHLNDSSS